MTCKTLFINPSLRPDAKRKYPPVGLALILTAVEKVGIEFDFIDMDAHCLNYADIEAHLRQHTYDVCAFGCIVTGLHIAKELCHIIRAHNPHCTIIVGNSVATSIPEILLTHTDTDIAVMGEGDVTIVELLQTLKKNLDWRVVPGISYKTEDGIAFSPKRPVVANLDDIGFPNWKLFDIALYNAPEQLSSTLHDIEKQVIFPLNGARGCPFSCTFCYHVFKGEKYRSYSENAIFAEFIRLTQEFGANIIMFWDELSFPNIASVQRLVDKLERLPFRTNWEGVCRAGLFKKNDEALLRRAFDTGCNGMAFSIENADPGILKAMNKKINHAHTVEHAHTLWKSNITPRTSLVFGYPQETPQTIKATLDLCKECNMYPSTGYLLPLPGTPIYQWAVQNNYIKDELEYLMRIGDRQDFHINLTTMPDEEFIQCVQEGLKALAKDLKLELADPLKTGVEQKSQKAFSE